MDDRRISMARLSGSASRQRTTSPSPRLVVRQPAFIRWGSVNATALFVVLAIVALVQGEPPLALVYFVFGLLFAAGAVVFWHRPAFTASRQGVSRGGGQPVSWANVNAVKTSNSRMSSRAGTTLIMTDGRRRRLPRLSREERQALVRMLDEATKAATFDSD